MNETLPTILLVDDAKYNLKILQSYLKEEPYNLKSCDSGTAAWEIISKSKPGDIFTVILDRVMPEMDGMEVMKNIKCHPELDSLPVIMQTSRSSEEDILEGIAAGANYYLTKPFTKERLCAVVKATVSKYRRYLASREESVRGQRGPILMTKGEFKFKTLEEANDLGLLLANACPDPKKVITGISELLINAIEHGNLGITYDDKSNLVDTQGWAEEVERRMVLPENKDKIALTTFTRNVDEIVIEIIDQGVGFDWQKYMEFDPARAFDSHGRGIFMAKSMSFDRLMYHGSGNHVEIGINITPTSD